MGSARKKYTQEYKAEAVELVVSSGRPVAEFTQSVSEGGSYLWTLGDDGELNMVPSSPGIHHTIASGGDPVLAAGQVTFGRGGRVTSFDNFTGH